jgi:hypothetical protein
MRLRRGDWLLIGAAVAGLIAFTPVRWVIEKAAGCKFTLPDMNFLSNAGIYHNAKTCLTGNGAAGLDAFFRWHLLGLDLVFPALLAAALTLVLFRISEALPRFARLGGTAKWLSASILPLSYALADYSGNWNVARWLKSGDDALLGLISTLTTLKFTALTVAGAVAVVFLLSALKGKRLQ